MKKYLFNVEDHRCSIEEFIDEVAISICGEFIEGEDFDDGDYTEDEFEFDEQNVEVSMLDLESLPHNPKMITSLREKIEELAREDAFQKGEIND